MQIIDVVDALGIKLFEIFGESYTIYTESIEQGTQKPCFFIAVLESSQKQVVGNRYHKTILFDIQYFGQNNTDTCITGDRLMNEMEYIHCANGDLLRGTKMRVKIEDGELHFFVNYNMHIYKVLDPIPTMEDLAIQSHTKRGG